MTRDIEHRMELSAIIGRRVTEILEDNGDGPHEIILSEYLQFEAALPRAAADALAMGEDYQFYPEDSTKVGTALGFMPDLLACFMNPVSDEYLLHVVRTTLMNEVQNRDCDICEDIFDDIIEMDVTDMVLVTDIAMGALGHVNMLGYDEVTDRRPVMLRLIETAAELDEDSLRRVLAYATQEGAGTANSDSALKFSAISKLREDHVSALQKNILDLLSKEPSNQLTAHSIQETLGLDSMAPLRKFDASIGSAIEKLTAAGVVMPNPVSVSKSPTEILIILDPEFAKAWKAFV